MLLTVRDTHILFGVFISCASGTDQPAIYPYGPSLLVYDFFVYKVIAEFAVWIMSQD